MMTHIFARMSDIEERRRQRAAFLSRLYDVVDGDVSTFVSAWDVAEEVGMDASEARRVVAYFGEKGLVHVDDHRAGTVRLTAAGVDHVEEGRTGQGTHPHEATGADRGKGSPPD